MKLKYTVVTLLLVSIADARLADADPTPRKFEKMTAAEQKKAIEEVQQAEEKRIEELNKQMVKTCEFKEIVFDPQEPLRFSPTELNEIKTKFQQAGMVVIPNKDVPADARYFGIACSTVSAKWIFAKVKKACTHIDFNDENNGKLEMPFVSKGGQPRASSANQQAMVIVDKFIETVKETRRTGKFPLLGQSGFATTLSPAFGGAGR